MVREIRIYVEGGGDRSDTKAAIRDGFNGFLRPLRDLAQQRGIRWALVVCGTRRKAFESFKIAIGQYPDALNVLLVDSESRVSRPPWEHLRNEDGWDVAGFSDSQCHLMVHTVEAWLVADPTALAEFYGQGFLQKALPKRADVEEIDKDTLSRSLDRATRKSRKGPYHKIWHCSDLLKRLMQERVRARARHCDLLFATLEAKITAE
jgi:uncharacterized protein DUF4276